MRISDWSSDVCSSDLHEPDGRSVKLLVRKGRKGKAPRKSKTRCRGTMMWWDETEKRICSAWMRGPSATTRRKARRASQPNAGARHHCLRAWMPELVPARIRREAQGTGEAGAEPACARSEEHTSELQSLMRISYAVFCLQKKTKNRSN